MTDQSRQANIEILAGDGKLDQLKLLLGTSYTQLELDIALENAIAFSQIETANYLITQGARIENYNYQGVYYAVHNNEIEGLKYAVSKGVDINISNGMPLLTSIETAINTKDIAIVKWLLDNGAKVDYLTQESLSSVNRYGTNELKDLIAKAQIT